MPLSPVNAHEEAKEVTPAGGSDPILDQIGSTPEELAAAATKISSVYKGRKDREKVKAMKEAQEASKVDQEADTPLKD